IARGAEGAPRRSAFGSGQWRRKNILYSRVSCTGHEGKLQVCPSSTNHRCSLSELASVVCRQNKGCDEGWIAGPEGCYLQDKGGKSFPQVAKRCKKKKGHLATVETETENNFLSVVLHNLNPGTQHWLIGGKRKKKQWLWVKQIKMPKTSKKRGRQAKKQKKSNAIIKTEMKFKHFFPGWIPGNKLKEPSMKKKEYCVALSKSFLHPNGSKVDVGYYYFDDVICATKKGQKHSYICEKPLQKSNDTRPSPTIENCYTGKGESYRGHVMQTERGTPCLKWTKSKNINPETHPNIGLGDHNFCRNPDDSLRPWCWVDVDRNRFGYCPVPKCAQASTTPPSDIPKECYTDTGTLYRGNATRTKKGYICQRWTTSIRVNPVTHPNKGLGNHNFCRNPDGDSRPWCWVRPLTNEYDYCVLEKCKEQKTTVAITTTSQPPVECSNDEFFCHQNTVSEKCIPRIFRCDNEIDCENGEDETGCDYKLPLFNVTRNTVLTFVANAEYETIPIELCARYCVESTTFVCRSFGYVIGGRECFLSDLNSESPNAKIRSSSRFDLYELKTQMHGCSTGYRCNNSKCIERNLTCNGRDDCGDLSDEQNCVSQTPPPLLIRLVDGDNDYSGRVELNYYGEWGVICDDGWDLKDAGVACRMLGYNFGARKAVVMSQFGSGNSNFLLDDVNCTGNEISLSDCNRKPWKSHDCKNYEVAGVICNPSKECSSDEFRCANKQCVLIQKICDGNNDCADNSDEQKCNIKIQLADGENNHSGRVEIVRNGVLGTVCDDGWDDKDAAVICRMMGFRDGGLAKKYSPGRGVIWLDDVECTGNETSIVDCPHRPWADHNCGHTEDAGVNCRAQKSPPNPDIIVELVDGGQPNRGRIEIIYSGVRGTVCNDDFGDEDANVVCRMLGYPSGRPTMQYGRGDGEIWLDNIDCTGRESSINQCSHNDWAINDCSHREDIGVNCEISGTTENPVVTVRLRGGRGRHEGRVEVTRGNVTGTVCDDRFSDENARVICRMLGYGNGEVAPEGMFGLGLDPILLDEVTCLGTEDSIVDCGHSGWGNHNCDHTEDVGVICMLPTTRAPTVSPGGSGRKFVRLVNNIDNKPGRGRVEVVVNGVAGTVCDDDWDDNDARVVCRQLGFKGGIAFSKARYGEGVGQILLDDVECRGTESSLFDCQSPRLGYNDCQHSEDASVICQTNGAVPIANLKQLPSDCGKRPLEKIINARKKRDLGERFVEERMKAVRIIGGSNADYGMYPWQVGVRKVVYESRYRRVDAQWCGGTILGEYWILSAAHCFHGLDKSVILLRTGDLNNKVNDSYEQEFKVDTLLIHESYDDDSYDFDIALLKIKPQNGRGIRFNDYVQPACLPSETSAYSQSYDCHISGWGKTSIGVPNMLKKAALPLLDQAVCKRLYKSQLSENMFCAGFTRGGIDTCKGDSGGPFVCNVEGRYSVLGVTSWGRGCGVPNAPGVYAHVRNLLPWITEKLEHHS
ncbi:hypothetical protein FSP39_010872, partial [Pinctada imbricata]